MLRQAQHDIFILCHSEPVEELIERFVLIPSYLLADRDRISIITFFDIYYLIITIVAPYPYSLNDAS